MASTTFWHGKFHLSDGTGKDGKLHCRASLELMRTPKVRKNATDDEMGIGWHLRKVNGETAAHEARSATACS